MVEWLNTLIENYITLDNIVKYSSIVLLILVMLAFWGKSWVMEQVNKGQEYWRKYWSI